MDYSAASSIGNIASSFISGYYANKVGKIQADAANYIRGANNTVIAKENERDAVITGLQRWRQGIHNKRVTENAAQDLEVGEINFNRQRDARSRASFSEQIRFAEEDGRMAAMAAASGVTGGVVDMLNMTSQLRKGIEDTNRAEDDRTFEYDHNRQKYAQWWANMDQLDYSLIMDNPRAFDYGRTEAKTASYLAGITTKDIKHVVQGVDFMFKSPDAPGLTTGDFSRMDRASYTE